MTRETVTIEGPNLVVRQWIVAESKPSVYLDGFQYKFNSELVRTEQRQLKHVIKEMLK